MDTSAGDPTSIAICSSCGYVLSNDVVAATDGSASDQKTKVDSQEGPASISQKRIAHFVLGRLLGRGGFGAVWLAEDLNLGRRVALKLPNSQHKDAQLLHEAKTAAKLKHPNIVAIYEVGTTGNQVYIASEFIDGESLRVKMTAGRLETRHAVELLVTISRAVQSAHDNAIVHRDLKPENIVMDSKGQPFVTDFGIAKQVSENETISTEGKMMGTVAYMSPEQARGISRDTDQRSDVYAIGTMLFEMLTEYRPFRGNARGIIHQKLYEDAPSPRKLVPLLPKDLETICLKCLQREPTKRYQQAAEVADELERFLNGIPIHARPISGIEFALRWCKRNQALTGLMSGVFLSLMIGLIGISYFWRRSERTSQQRQESLYQTSMMLASNLWSDGDIDGVRGLLTRFDGSNRDIDQRQFEWFYFEQAIRPFRTIADHGDSVVDVAVSHNGKLFASVGRDRMIRVWDTESGTLVRTLRAGTTRVTQVRFAPTSNRLISTHDDGVARVWSPKQHDQPALKLHHGGNLLAALFCQDDQLIITLDSLGTVMWWNAKGESTKQIDDVGQNIVSMAVSPLNDRLAIAQRNGVVKIVTTNDGNLSQTVDTKVRLGSVAFTADGERLIAGGGADSISITHLGQPDSQQFRAFDTIGVGDIEYLPNSDQIAVVLANNNLLLLNSNHEPVRKLPTHSLSMGVLGRSRDGKVLAVGSGDGTIKVLALGRLRTPQILWHDKHVRDVTFLDDSQTLVACTGDGTVVRWNIDTGEPTELLPAAGREMLSLHYQPTTKELFAVGMFPYLFSFAHDSQDHANQDRLSTSGMSTVCVSDDGRWLALGSRGGMIMVFDQSTKEVIHELIKPDAQVTDAVFLRDNVHIAVAYSTGEVNLVEVATAKIINEFNFESIPQVIGRSPLAGKIAVGTQRGDIHLLDLPSGERTTIDAHQGRINDVAFFPDATRMVSVGRDKKVRLWDLESLTCVAMLYGHERQIFSVAVSADGHRIASAGLDGDVRLWRIDESK